jgi:Zn-dependent protease
LFNSIQSGRFNDPGQWLTSILLLLPGIVIGITFHEFAHAFAAWKLGDQTPLAQKRVTLNPLAHIDPIGILILIFVGFGWGRPVQVNPYAFKGNRRRSSLIVDVAGVVTNLIIAFLIAALAVVILNTATYSAPMAVFYNILIRAVMINLVLMLFNLIPVPPLDGFGIVTEVFDLRQFSWHHQLYNSGMFILLGLIVLRSFGGPDVIGWFIGPAMKTIPDAFSSFWQTVLF